MIICGIKCEICGVWLKSITHSHLRKHGTTLKEYIEKYGYFRSEATITKTNLSKNCGTREEQRARRAAYKAAYYQTNKVRIRERKQAGPPTSIEKMRQYSLKYNYGISPEEYAKMLHAQGNSCFLCGRPHGESMAERLCVDHNHDTGKIRGLLCRRCNVGIGYLQEDHELIRRTADYVESHSR